MAGSDVLVTTLIIDAAQATQGAQDFERAAQRIEQSSARAAASVDRLGQSVDQAGKSMREGAAHGSAFAGAPESLSGSATNAARFTEDFNSRYRETIRLAQSGAFSPVEDARQFARLRGERQLAETARREQPIPETQVRPSVAPFVAPVITAAEALPFDNAALDALKGNPRYTQILRQGEQIQKTDPIARQYRQEIRDEPRVSGSADAAARNAGLSSLAEDAALAQLVRGFNERLDLLQAALSRAGIATTAPQAAGAGAVPTAAAVATAAPAVQAGPVPLLARSAAPIPEAEQAERSRANIPRAAATHNGPQAELELSDYEKAIEKGPVAAAAYAASFRGVSSAVRSGAADFHGAATAAEGLAGAMNHVSGAGGRVREGFVIGRELLAGNFTRLIGSATIELQRFGALGLLLNPVTLGISSTIGAMALLIHRSSEIDANIRSFDATLRTMGTSGEASGAGLEKTAEELKHLGISADDAKRSVDAVIRTPGISPRAAPQIAQIGNRVAQYAGGEPAQRVDELAKATRAGVEGLIKYGEQYNAFSRDQINTFRELERAGQGQRAVAGALDILDHRLPQIKDLLSDFQLGTLKLRNSWDDLLTSLSKTPAVEGTISALTKITEAAATPTGLGTISGAALGAVALTALGPRAGIGRLAAIPTGLALGGAIGAAGEGGENPLSRNIAAGATLGGLLGSATPLGPIGGAAAGAILAGVATVIIQGAQKVEWGDAGSKITELLRPLLKVTGGFSEEEGVRQLYEAIHGQTEATNKNTSALEHPSLTPSEASTRSEADRALGGLPQSALDARLDKFGGVAGGTGQRLIDAVIQAESRGHADVVSSKGAVGIMQVLPSTAREIAPEVTREQLFNPKINIPIGTEYLRRQIEEFGSVFRGLEAYNAGPERVRRELRGTQNLPPETVAYAKGIIQNSGLTGNEGVEALGLGRSASPVAAPTDTEKGKIDEIARQNRENLEVEKETPGFRQERARAAVEQERRAREQFPSQPELQNPANEEAQTAYDQILAQRAQHERDLAQLRIQLEKDVAQASARSWEEGLQARAHMEAVLTQRERGGEVPAIQRDTLTLQAQQAIAAGEAEIKRADTRVIAEHRIAEASQISRAATIQSAIANQAYEFAEDAARKAGTARVGGLDQEAAALARKKAVQLQSIEADREATEAGSHLQRGRNELQAIGVRSSFVAQSSIDTERQLSLLRVEQELRDRYSQAPPDVRNSIASQGAELANANALLAETEQHQQRIDALFRSIADTVDNTLGNALRNSLIRTPLEASQHLKNYWRDLREGLRSSIADITSTIAQAAFIKPVTSLIASGLGLGKVAQEIGGFATGGDKIVGGSGGTDSQLVQFMATPGERVVVLTPAQSQHVDKTGMLPHFATGGEYDPATGEVVSYGDYSTALAQKDTPRGDSVDAMRTINAYDNQLNIDPVINQDGTPRLSNHPGEIRIYNRIPQPGRVDQGLIGDPVINHPGIVKPESMPGIRGVGDYAHKALPHFAGGGTYDPAAGRTQYFNDAGQSFSLPGDRTKPNAPVEDGLFGALPALANAGLKDYGEFVSGTKTYGQPLVGFDREKMEFTGRIPVLGDFIAANIIDATVGGTKLGLKTLHQTALDRDLQGKLADRMAAYGALYETGENARQPNAPAPDTSSDEGMARAPLPPPEPQARAAIPPPLPPASATLEPAYSGLFDVLPALATGGSVAQTGAALVHAGEIVLPTEKTDDALRSVTTGLQGLATVLGQATPGLQTLGRAAAQFGALGNIAHAVGNFILPSANAAPLSPNTGLNNSQLALNVSGMSSGSTLFGPAQGGTTNQSGNITNVVGGGAPSVTQPEPAANAAAPITESAPAVAATAIREAAAGTNFSLSGTSTPIILPAPEISGAAPSPAQQATTTLPEVIVQAASGGQAPSSASLAPQEPSPLAAAAATQAGIPQREQQAPTTAPASTSPFSAGNLSTAVAGLSIIDKLNTSLPGFLPSFLQSGSGSAVGSFLSNPFGLFASQMPAGDAIAQGLGPLAPNAAGNVTVPGLFGTTATFGSFLSGAGAGFGAGFLLNNLLGGNAVGGTIGSAGGALAGAAIGSIFPGVGTLIGGLIGGAAGGGLGGLIGGPPSGQSAGAVVGPNGQLTFNDTGGSQANISASTQVAQQIGAFTRALSQLTDAYGNPIGSVSGSAVVSSNNRQGIQVFGSNIAGGTFGQNADTAVQQTELQLIHSLTNVTSDTLRTIFQNINDPSQLQNAVQFAAVYDRLNVTAAQLTASLNGNVDAIGPFQQALTQAKTTFTQLTAQANQFGLSTAPIAQALQAVTDTLNTDFRINVAEALSTAIDGGNDFIASLVKIHQTYVQAASDAQALSGVPGPSSLGFVTQAGSILGASPTAAPAPAAAAPAASAPAESAGPQLTGDAEKAWVALEAAAGKAGFKFANGGTTPAGWILVGERGPEWMFQPGGATILPNGVRPSDVPSPAGRSFAQGTIGAGDIAGQAPSVASAISEASGGPSLLGAAGGALGISADTLSTIGDVLPIAGPLLGGALGAVTGHPLQGAIGATASLVGFALGGPIGGAIGGLVGLLGNLFGPKPSNRSSGDLVDLASGAISGFQSSGDGKADKIVQDVSQGISRISMAFQEATGGTISGAVSVQDGRRDGLKTSYSGPQGTFDEKWADTTTAVEQFGLAIAHNLQGIDPALQAQLAGISDPNALIPAIENFSGKSIDLSASNPVSAPSASPASDQAPAPSAQAAAPSGQASAPSDQVSAPSDQAVAAASPPAPSAGSDAGPGLSGDALSAWTNLVKVAHQAGFPIKFANGGTTPQGWILVGERGPEWMYQPGGATVLPNGVQPSDVPSPAGRFFADGTIADGTIAGTPVGQIYQAIAGTEAAQAAPVIAGLGTDQLTTVIQQLGQVAPEIAKMAQDLINSGNALPDLVTQAIEALTDPLEIAIQKEKALGAERVAAATATGQDLVKVEQLNSANLVQAVLNNIGNQNALNALVYPGNTKALEYLQAAPALAQLSGQQLGALQANIGDVAPDLAALAQDFIDTGTALPDTITQALQAIVSPLQLAIEQQRAQAEGRNQVATVTGQDQNTVAALNTASILQAVLSDINNPEAMAALVANGNPKGLAQLQGGPVLAGLGTDQLQALLTAIGSAAPDITDMINALVASGRALPTALKQADEAITMAGVLAVQKASALGFEQVQGAAATGQSVSDAQRLAADEVAQAIAQATNTQIPVNGLPDWISQIEEAATAPLQLAIQKEQAAGAERVAIAQATGADLARVEKANADAIAQAWYQATAPLTSLKNDITSGSLSGLTPANQVPAAIEQFNQVLKLVQGGNTNFISELASAGTAAVQASQQAYGNGPQTASVRSQVLSAISPFLVSASGYPSSGPTSIAGSTTPAAPIGATDLQQNTSALQNLTAAITGSPVLGTGVSSTTIGTASGTPGAPSTTSGITTNPVTGQAFTGTGITAVAPALPLYPSASSLSNALAAGIAGSATSQDWQTINQGLQSGILDPTKQPGYALVIEQAQQWAAGQAINPSAGLTKALGDATNGTPSLQEWALINQAVNAGIISPTATPQYSAVIQQARKIANAQAESLSQVPNNQTAYNTAFYGLPAFASGTDTTPPGLIMVGEEGPELYHPANDNEWSIVGGRGPAVMNQPGGATIIPLPHFADGTADYQAGRYAWAGEINSDDQAAAAIEKLRAEIVTELQANRKQMMGGQMAAGADAQKQHALTREVVTTIGPGIRAPVRRAVG